MLFINNPRPSKEPLGGEQASHPYLFLYMVACVDNKSAGQAFMSSDFLKEMRSRRPST